MHGYYDPGLVALSFAIAVIASYTALELAGCVSSSTSSSKKSLIWLIAGAVAMGSGIWSMHFIGMLAFHLPIAVAYDLPISLLSMLIAIIVSAIALFILRRPQVGALHFAVGAILMGIGISAMHYTGMLAMQMSPPIRYDPLLFTASVLIATGASLAALLIAFQLRRQHSKLAMLAKIASAGVMAVAITGMHYTGMAAAQFAPGSVCGAANAGSISNMLLAFGIGVSALAILSLTLIVSALDAHFAINNAKLAASLNKITVELHESQSEVVSSARQAGMAEIANNVLHNVGNVLNSVAVSAGLLGARLRDSKARGLTDAVRLMNEHVSDIGDFLTHDDRGKRILGYLDKLVEALAAERRSLMDELVSLTKSVDHIKDIVATQQSYAGPANLIEPVQISELVADAVRINAASMARHEVALVTEVAEVPLLLMDEHLMLQILINLIGNAKQAMDAVPDRLHRVTLRVDETHGPDEHAADGRSLRIRIEDNGEGIDAQNFPKLFQHGFTTRKSGHGFGLHSCALGAKGMGGTLTAHSDGPGRGATFTLLVPMNLAPVLQ
jgi:NO-binding membrane sensor protein with MHYT domain